MKEDREVVGSVKFGTRPWGLAFSPDEKLIYVANGPSNDVSVIDVAALKEAKRIPAGESPWAWRSSHRRRARLARKRSAPRAGARGVGIPASARMSARGRFVLIVGI